ncbi:expressed unknown protein [Seminavis robusta]|uniref:Uncharacterized protein n=1 Tax=Seminavis robusta TaxID=568900 RepID=A0A9N8H8M6_9STRA|nr:expressed unknown protein [Seminavis robusta]|eukprot:Sro246_g097610.1 n/a (328) ;mRNA; f:13255-14238
MDFGCCSAAQDRVVEDDSGDLPNSMISYSDSLGSFDCQANTLSVDYRNVTPLFRALEQEDWKAVLVFLATGRWSSSPLSSAYDYLHDPSPERQARTWVHCTGSKGETQWKQLPLHAAISYLAPLPVVQKLVEFYGDALRSADDTGNLPLHLAFGFGSSDSIVAYLIKEYPQALSIKGLQNRRPVDCCDLGPNKLRGEIIRACQEHTRSSMMKDWDQHWKKSLHDAKQRAGLLDQFSANSQTLEEVFNELVQVKIELKKTQELAKSRPTMIITKTEPVPDEKVPRSLGKAPSEMSRMVSFSKRLKPKAILRSIRSSQSSTVAPSSSGK